MSPAAVIGAVGVGGFAAAVVGAVAASPHGHHLDLKVGDEEVGGGEGRHDEQELFRKKISRWQGFFCKNVISGWGVYPASI